MSRGEAYLIVYLIQTKIHFKSNLSIIKRTWEHEDNIQIVLLKVLSGSFDITSYQVQVHRNGSG